MTIRAANPIDIPALAKLAQETYTDTFGHTMSQDELAQALDSRSEAYFRSVLGTDTLLVAEEGRQIIGFIQFGKVSYESIKTTDSDIELNKIYVDKSKQGKGIGKQLMEAMLSHDRLKDVKNIYLDVYAENEKAAGLYTKYGFEVIGKTPFKVEGKILGYDLLMKRTQL